MDNKSELIEQTDLAFNFIQKLYLEVSYLIKEVEAILNEEQENFRIGKPGGYAISTRRSQGLESANVNLWLIKKLAVYFVPEGKTEVKGGQHSTRFDDDLKVFYLRVVLQDRSINEPTIYSGVLYNIKNKGKAAYIKKFDNLMQYFEYDDNVIFKDPEKIDYDDSYIALKGELIRNSLFDINNAEAILEKVVKSSLDLYRKH